MVCTSFLVRLPLFFFFLLVFTILLISSLIVRGSAVQSHPAIFTRTSPSCSFYCVSSGRAPVGMAGYITLANKSPQLLNMKKSKESERSGLLTTNIHGAFRATPQRPTSFAAAPEGQRLHLSRVPGPEPALGPEQRRPVKL